MYETNSSPSVPCVSHYPRYHTTYTARNQSSDRERFIVRLLIYRYLSYLLSKLIESKAKGAFVNMSRMSAMEKAMEAERKVTRQVGEVADEWEKWQTNGRSGRRMEVVADEWEKGLLAFRISSTPIPKGSPVVRLINS